METVIPAPRAASMIAAGTVNGFGLTPRTAMLFAVFNRFNQHGGYTSSSSSGTEDSLQSTSSTRKNAAGIGGTDSSDSQRETVDWNVPIIFASLA